MAKNINSILRGVLNRINPAKEELNSIDRYLKQFISQFEKKLKANRISAEVFVGGSFAKKTLIKKGQYDIDIFVRFDEKYKKQDISKLTERILRSLNLKNLISIHGSRDYFKINVNSVFFCGDYPCAESKKS